MPKERSPYIDVDRLLSQATLEQAAAAYGDELSAGTDKNEVRLACPFSCEQASGRPVSVNTALPHKPFICRAYQCQVRGNLLSLMYGLKHGTLPPGGQLKGADFRAMAQDLQAIVEGEPEKAEPHQAADQGERTVSDNDASESSSTSPGQAADRAPAVNILLKRSPNERARALVRLDEQFVVEPNAMSPAAGKYLRARPFLTPEVCRMWRAGYLPQDAPGMLRGRFVYPFLSESGEVLSWFGRDPALEEKHRQWEQAGRPAKSQPIKMKFVKGFHRGAELFGQQAARLANPVMREQVKQFGIIVVEGPNDVIALDCLGVPAVGLCGNCVTAEQAVKLSRWAAELSDGRVTLLLDCDDPGESGAKESLWILAERGLQVQLAGSKAMHGGQFSGRQPESLTREEWDALAAVISHAR